MGLGMGLKRMAQKIESDNSNITDATKKGAVKSMSSLIKDGSTRKEAITEISKRINVDYWTVWSWLPEGK